MVVRITQAACTRLLVTEVAFAVVHSIAGVAFAIVGLLLFDFRFALVKSVIDDVPGGFEAAFLPAFSLDPTWLLVATSAVTAASHMCRALAVVLCPGYVQRAAVGCNVGYFAEFIISAPLLYLINVLLSGRLDIASALLLACLFGAVNAGGLFVELGLYNKRANGVPVSFLYDVALPFSVYGGVALLAVLCSVSDFIFSATSSGGVPWFVFIIATYTNFMYAVPFASTFAAQRLAEWRRPLWVAKNPFFFQYEYAALSLFSKLVPAIILCVGLARMT